MTVHDNGLRCDPTLTAIAASVAPAFIEQGVLAAIVGKLLKNGKSADDAESLSNAHLAVRVVKLAVAIRNELSVTTQMEELESEQARSAMQRAAGEPMGKGVNHE